MYLLKYVEKVENQLERTVSLILTESCKHGNDNVCYDDEKAEVHWEQGIFAFNIISFAIEIEITVLNQVNKL